MRLTLSRDPFASMSRLQQAMLNDDNFFNVDWDDTQVDLYEEGDRVFVKAKVPGFDEKNVEIALEENILSISGKVELREEEEAANRKFYRQEISMRSFNRQVTLPTKVNPDTVSAQFKNGMLIVEFEKAEEVKPRKIEIKANS